MAKSTAPPVRIVDNEIQADTQQVGTRSKWRLKWGWWVAFYVLVSPAALLFIIPLAVQFFLIITRKISLNSKFYVIIGFNAVLNFALFWGGNLWWPDDATEMMASTSPGAFLIGYMSAAIFTYVTYTALQSFFIYNAAKEYEKASLLSP